MKSNSARSRTVTAVVGLVLFAAVWLGVAGRLTWWPGWGLLVTFSAYVGALLVRLSAVNPDLLRERIHSAEKAEPWDRVIVGFIGLPLALGSWWGMIPGVVIVGLFAYRTHREDLMLVGGLAGYAEYAEKVRYRPLPCMW